MNTPNKLTIFRVILVPVFVLFILLDADNYTYRVIAEVVFVIASITDALDGYLARKNNQVTNFGKFMDPLADKLLVCSALICLITTNQIPAWVVIVIIAREFIISGFRLVASDNGIVIAASIWGKAKTATTMAMIIVLIINFSEVFAGNIFGTIMFFVEQILIYVSLILTIVSLIDYIVKNKTVLSEDKMNK